MKIKSTNIIKQNENIICIVLVTAFILLIPLTAMQFTDEVDWGLGDFAIIGTLLLGTGFTYEFISRRVDKKYRVILGIVLVVSLLLVWAELAVGIFGTPFAGS